MGDTEGLIVDVDRVLVSVLLSVLKLVKSSVSARFRFR